MSRSNGGRCPRRVPTLPAGAALVALALVVSGCGGGAADDRTGARAAPSTRPAMKQTCPDVAWAPPASVPLEHASRELVPFAPTLLGVQSTWRGNGFTVETVSGGYVDDLTEPYDNLQPTGTLSLHGDSHAEVMHGSLQGSPVLLVLWRDRTQAVPCDVHAFLVQGADLPTEELLLKGLG
jgi:hypothetical protein